MNYAPKEECVKSPLQNSNLSILSNKPLINKLPKEYWANSMQPGESKVINGVLHRKVSSSKPLITTLENDIVLKFRSAPNELHKQIEGIDASSQNKRLEQRHSLIDWTIDKHYLFLPKEDRESVRDSFYALAQQALNVTNQIKKGNLEIETGHKKMSILLAQLLLNEYNVFKDNPDTRKHQFGKVLDTSKPPPPEQQLSDAVLPFVNGKFYTVKVIDKPEQPSFKVKSSLSDALFTCEDYLNSLSPSTRTHEHVESHYIGGFEGRIFVAEHPVLDWWEWGPVHSGIIAGFWRLEVETRIVEKYHVQQPPLGVQETAEARIKRLIGTLISKKRYTIQTWRFGQWDWSNGAMGSFNDNDWLTLVERISPSPANDISALNRAIFGYTPDSGERYCRNRATSYSLGLYGIDFVCHQTANAFMLNRRGYAPIYHAYSSVLYGTVGNSGVSECSDWKGSAMHGCIPGNWCEGNHTPYISISEEPAAMVLEAAPGDGFGLDSVWAPTKDWIYSQAKYNERLPTIPIEDDQPIITVEDLTVS